MAPKKRDRNGDFVPWASSSQRGSSLPTMSQPYSSQTMAASTPSTSQNAYASYAAFANAATKQTEYPQPSKKPCTTPPKAPAPTPATFLPAATSYKSYGGYASYTNSVAADDNPQPAKKKRTNAPKPTTQTPASILPTAPTSQNYVKAYIAEDVRSLARGLKGFAIFGQFRLAAKREKQAKGHNT